jgi:hypothetical protein
MCCLAALRVTSKVGKSFKSGSVARPSSTSTQAFFSLLATSTSPHLSFRFVLRFARTENYHLCCSPLSSSASPDPVPQSLPITALSCRRAPTSARWLSLCPWPTTARRCPLKAPRSRSELTSARRELLLLVLLDASIVNGIPIDSLLPSYSGVAWTSWSGKIENTDVIMSWGTERHGCSDREKCPTALHIDQYDNVTWGYDTPQGKECLEWFKLLLIAENDLRSSSDNAQSSRSCLLIRLGACLVLDRAERFFHHVTRQRMVLVPALAMVLGNQADASCSPLVNHLEGLIAWLICEPVSNQSRVYCKWSRRSTTHS